MTPFLTGLSIGLALLPVAYRAGRRSVRRLNTDQIRAAYAIGKRYGPEIERLVDEDSRLAEMAESGATQGRVGHG